MRLAMKFVAALVLTIAVAVAFRTAADAQRAFERTDAEVRAAQHMLAEVLSLAVVTVWEANGWEAALQLLKRVELTQGTTTIRWVWLDEQPYEEYRPSADRARLEPLRSGTTWLELSPATFDAPLVSYRAIALKGLPPGALELVHFTGPERAAARREWKIQLMTSGAIVLAYALLATLLGWRWVARPIRRLVQHARRVAEGELGFTSPISQRDEIGVLAQTMNRMSSSLLDARTRAEAEHSARLETSRQLAHADRLASVGRLAAATAHDVGTPLNVIAGRAELMAENGTEAGARDGARRILEQAQNVIALIRGLLGYARADDGAQQPVALQALVTEVVTLVSPLARRGRTRLEVRPCPASPIVRLSRAQVRQVLVNLVTNAIQATPPGGRITLEVGTRQTASGAEEPFIAVRDEGAGIAPQHLPFIFEPFFTTKREGEGTGLGLSVCQLLVAQNGGRLEVASTVGQGSTFTVVFPPGGQSP